MERGWVFPVVGRHVGGLLAGLTWWYLTATGVAAEQAPDRSADAKTIIMTVRLLDSERQVLSDQTFTGEVTLLFPFLAGTLLGETEGGAAIRKRVRVGDRLIFDLGLLRRTLDSAARPWEDSDLHRPLRISPPDARVVRLGVLSLRDEDELFFDQTLLVDPETGDTLLLVYIDRACSVRGIGHTTATDIEHDIAFSYSGFHWVRVHPSGAGRLRLSEARSVQEAVVGLVLVGRKGRAPQSE